MRNARTVLLLGYRPQVCNSFACPDSRPKEEPGVSDRDISSLLDGGSDVSEAKSWSDTLQCAAEGKQNLVGVFTPGEKRRLTVLGELMLVGFSVTTETSIRASPHHFFDKYNLYLGPGPEISVRRYRRIRHWLSWACTESRRIATLSGLTIQLLKLIAFQNNPESITYIQCFDLLHVRD